MYQPKHTRLPVQHVFLLGMSAGFHVLPALHTAKTKGTYDLYGEEALKSTIDSGGLPLAGQLH